MYGHQLRLLAEKEHVQIWTDISVGALYGAMKRLAAVHLIDEVRTEREGSYPERQVYAITDAGRSSLATLRLSGLSETVMKPDPFDLAMTRLDRTKLDDLPATIETRLATLRRQLAESIERTQTIKQYLTPVELFVMGHQANRIGAEVSWHEQLLSELSAIIADESARKDHHHD